MQAATCSAVGMVIAAIAVVAALIRQRTRRKGRAWDYSEIERPQDVRRHIL